MNNFLSQLNMTPQERRIVVVIFLVVIFVLNLLFVWPHFSEWGAINKQLDDTRGKIRTYNDLIQKDLNPTNGFKMLVQKYSQLEGGGHLEEHAVDPQIQLGNTIRAQERKTGVTVENFSPGSIKTNAFFEELSTAITVQSQEPPLVNFLYNMGMDPAMIRVARLDLKAADANRYALKGTITLTANYTKKPPTTAAAPAPIPGTRPAPATSKSAPNGRPAAGPPSPASLNRPPHSMPSNRQPPALNKPNFPTLPARPLPKTARPPGQAKTQQ